MPLPCHIEGAKTKTVTPGLMLASEAKSRFLICYFTYYKVL